MSNDLEKRVIRVFLCFVKISLYVHRLLVERVFAQYMVPHNLDTAERMKCLYYLYATLDTNAVKYVLDVYKLAHIC